MQASRTLDCTDSDIISETCKIHSLTFPSNYLILGLDFSMPLAPSFHIVLVNKLLPFAMWTSLTSRTTMGAVWPCPLPGLGHPQLVKNRISVLCCRHRLSPFTRCLAVAFPWVSLTSITAKCKQHGKHTFQSFSYAGHGFPYSGYRSGGLALYLIHRFLSLRIRLHRISVLLRRLIRFLTSNDMLHSPSGFPSRISRRIIGCFCGLWASFSRIFAENLILLPTAC